MLYTVGEMAKMLGIPASTIRYYDKEGLLPFVERSSGGIRMFKAADYEWLKTIQCLKKTGMPLKEIRTFVRMSMEGDTTISQRLEIIQAQRELVKGQIAEQQQILKMLDFKCWYYETAKAAGTTEVPRTMPLSQLPKGFREVRKYLRNE